MWPWKKKEVVPPPVEEEKFEFSISHSGMDLLMKYTYEVKDLLWSALEEQAKRDKTKLIEQEDVEKIGSQVVAALKQLIEEHE